MIASAQATTTGINVLVIDDNPTERALIKAKLNSAGHNADCAASGEEAVARLQAGGCDYDLLLLDMTMPGMDGLEAARRIRALEGERDQDWRPIIFLSGRTDAESVAAGIHAGGDDYLHKPVDAKVLNAKIASMRRIAAARGALLARQGQLEREANFDGLTGLANRRHFTRLLQAEVGRAKRQHSQLALAYIDLDHFKRLNDTYGHAAGDEVLRAVAALFTGNIRAEDVIGRLGGEEFCLFMPGIDRAGAQLACERYRAGIEALEVVSGAHRVRVTASIGLAQFDHLRDDMDALLQRADTSLYQAKNSGRNRVL